MDYQPPSSLEVGRMAFQYGAPILAELIETKEQKLIDKSTKVINAANKNKPENQKFFEISLQQGTLKIVDQITRGTVGEEFISVESLEPLCGRPRMFTEANLHKKVGYFVLPDGSDKKIGYRLIPITEQQYYELKAQYQGTKNQVSNEKE